MPDSRRRAAFSAARLLLTGFRPVEAVPESADGVVRDVDWGAGCNGIDLFTELTER